MELIDLNPHGGIGANAHFIRLGGFSILIDCGLHPKHLGLDALPALHRLKNERLDLIVLTHCHLDHVGALPLAAAAHPEAPVITSIPNLTLAPRMLRNSINVMRRQREEHGITDYPLFVHRDIANLEKQFFAQRFGRGEIHFKKKERIEVILHPAGHIAGAAAVEFVHDERRVLFSGDVLFDTQRTLPGANLPEGDLDTLILETTRGGTSREEGPDRTAETKRLLAKIRDILEQGGSCLIPVFALGRMQEIFKILFEARKSGELPHCPILAAGLGMDLCRIFENIRRQSRLVDFDAEMLNIMEVRAPDPNMKPGRDLPKKGIYLVSSGMLVEHTPSYHTAASILPHGRNGVCFVGYCDPDTPGGSLLAQKDESHFFFETLDYRAPIRASIDQFDLSGHADREELAEYAAATRPRTIVLSHGDPDAREWFAGTLSERLPETRILDPEPLVEYIVKT
ncbi:MAG: MBL fold metallo-hydrolase [Opitutales bacterium]